MQAFISYQTKDRLVAAELQTLLKCFSIKAFMAHEDIEISDEWQEAILYALRKSELFFAVLSVGYLTSPFCMQEAGIAMAREKPFTIIPLSIDGTVSPGFMNKIQSKKVTPGSIDEIIVTNAIARHDVSFAIDTMTDYLSQATNWRGAEFCFKMLQPFLAQANQAQSVRVLKVSAANNQIWDAIECARSYLPPLYSKFGYLLPEAERKVLERAISNCQPDES